MQGAEVRGVHYRHHQLDYTQEKLQSTSRITHDILHIMPFKDHYNEEP